MLNQIKVTTKWLLSLTLTTLLSTTIHAYDQAGDGAAGDSMSETQKTDYGVGSSNATTYDTAGYAAAASQVSNYNEALQARHETAQGKAGTTSWSRDINATVGDIKLYHSAVHDSNVIEDRDPFNIIITENTDTIELGSFDGYYDLKDDSIVYNKDETASIEDPSGNYYLGTASWSGSEEFAISVLYATQLNITHPDVLIQGVCSYADGSTLSYTTPNFIAASDLNQGAYSTMDGTEVGTWTATACSSYLVISEDLDGASIKSLDDLVVTTFVVVQVASP